MSRADNGSPGHTANRCYRGSIRPAARASQDVGLPQAVSYCTAAPIKRPFASWSRTARSGRLLPVEEAIFRTVEGQLIGDSGHSEKRHRSTDA